ncbi:DnaB-like helicase C-terminal domain-containing protein [Streptomyces vinaceus]|uniref:DnaB-like helicase C-terminal domain-containing protein n=1 Tax=Streptomyces vinaceus TaxID=1960 RepID=UPI00381DB412
MRRSWPVSVQPRRRWPTPAALGLQGEHAIEQDSNVVLLLHEERDENDRPVKPGEVDLIIAKNRQGMSGRVLPMSVRKHYMRIDSWAADAS